MCKMNFPVVAFMLLFFALSTFAPGLVRGQADAAEMKKFQGKWKMVSAEMDGKKVKIFTPHQNKDTITATITKFDLSKDPRVMYWLRDVGPNAGKTMPAIYRFGGTGNLQVCFDPSMTALPGKFVTDPGSGHIRHTWKREKK